MKKRIVVYISLITIFICLIINYSAYNHIADNNINLSRIDTKNILFSDRIVKNVYIILVDGLRYDSVLHYMPNVSKLILDNKACLIKSRLVGPSYSRPGYARIFTGASTNINDIWNNNQENACKITSLFKNARRCNLTTGASAYFWIGQLFNRYTVKDKISLNTDNIQYSYFYSDENEKDTVIFDKGKAIIEKYNPNLCLILPMEVDIAGHKYGAISKEYSMCVARTDELISQLIEKLDLKNSVMLVISDHGHKDSGGHGGNSRVEIETPVIIIGKIVKGGIYSEIIIQEDIAPTVCALLGMPPTPYMSGNIIDFVFNINKKYFTRITTD